MDRTDTLYSPMSTLHLAHFQELHSVTEPLEAVLYTVHRLGDKLVLLQAESIGIDSQA
jgi:hypothetical protein